MNINKNDAAFKELDDFAKSKNKPLKDVLLSDDYLDQVADIFHKHMPLTIRIVMNKNKFKSFYSEHREKLVNQITGL